MIAPSKRPGAERQASPRGLGFGKGIWDGAFAVRCAFKFRQDDASTGPGAASINERSADVAESSERSR
jgi:hypothetical protein